MIPDRLAPRELAYCGLCGAAALLLPTLFHLLQLGRVFMPLYVPLMILPFFVRARAAATTAGLAPLLSAALTGMPPWYPPVALLMASELALMAGLLGWLAQRWPRCQPVLLLVPVLLLGRLAYAVLAYGSARWLAAPAGWFVGLSWLSAWPGILLMTIVVPAVVRIARQSARPTLTAQGSEG